MPLTDTKIRGARPQAKPYKLADGDGLTLLVNPNGSKWWRLRYRIGGREKMLSVGVYPDVPLKHARDKRDSIRKLIASGVDPSVKREAEKKAQADTFAAIAAEWLDFQRNGLRAATLEKAEWTINDLLNPFIGRLPIRAITAPEILAALRRLEARGKHETAHRTKQRAGQIFRYAIATGRAERDPTADLRGALAPIVTTNHAAITDPKEVGQLLRAIHSYRGQPATECAMKLKKP